LKDTNIIRLSLYNDLLKFNISIIFKYLQLATLYQKGGLLWIAYGATITIVPVLICGFLGKFIFKLRYSALIGVLSGANTNPPALAFAGEQDKYSDDAAVGYATVYPITMFLRVLAAQVMVLILV